MTDKTVHNPESVSSKLLGLAFAVISGLTIVGIVIGFLFLGWSYPESHKLTWWEAICRAAGLEFAASKPELPRASNVSTRPVGSTLAWNATTRDFADDGRKKNGELLVEGCLVCHGDSLAPGMTPAPRLWYMDARSIYKQMIDYREGRRQDEVMKRVAEDLTDQEIADLAKYFAQSGRKVSMSGKGSAHTMRLVNTGDPTRNIVACVACHGPVAYKYGAPKLFGLSEAYILDQLNKFASGERANDSLRQMRYIASGMTQDEHADLAKYFGAAAANLKPGE